MMEYGDSEHESDFADDLLGPEDLFNDEADEDREGGQSENDGDEDDKGETNDTKDVKVKVEKKVKRKRTVKNRRVRVTYETLTGPKGLTTLKKLFKNFKFKGSGHENEDLSEIIKILKQWTGLHLCPNYDFECCLADLERLGRKKNVQTCMNKFRMNIDDWGEVKSDEENNGLGCVENMEVNDKNANQEKDDFDLLLNEPITDVDLEKEFCVNQDVVTQSQFNPTQSTQKEVEFTLTPEQLERIAMNRKLAEERRLKRMSQQQQERMEVNDTQTENRESEISLEQMNLDDNN